MKTILLFFFYIIATNHCFSQAKALRITHPSHVDLVLKDGKRIKLKTLEGKKNAGYMRIVDNNTIRIRRNIIPLAEVIMIKKHPLGFTIFSNTLIGTVVVAGVGFGLIVSAPSEDPVYLVISLVGAAPLIYGIASELNVSHRLRKELGYSFTIIDTPATIEAG